MLRSFVISACFALMDYGNFHRVPNVVRFVSFSSSSVNRIKRKQIVKMSLLCTIAMFVLILEQGWKGTGQMFLFWVPLGRFDFLPPFPAPTAPPAPTTDRPQTLAESIGRPLKDISVPFNTDVAAVAAQENAILTTIRSCSPMMKTAKLGCPCGQPGKRCADPLSLRNLQNHCVCDGKLGYANSRGDGCTAYAIPTTSKPSTRTTTTTSTTSTSITTTTTPAATTSTTTATTSSPFFTICTVEDGQPHPAPSPPKTIMTPGYLGGTFYHPSPSGCLTTFAGQPGKKLQFQFLDYQVQTNGQGTFASCVETRVVLMDSSPVPLIHTYCLGSPAPLPAPVTFDTGLNAILNIVQTGAGSEYKLQILVTYV